MSHESVAPRGCPVMLGHDGHPTAATGRKLASTLPSEEMSQPQTLNIWRQPQAVTSGYRRWSSRHCPGTRIELYFVQKTGEDARGILPRYLTHVQRILIFWFRPLRQHFSGALHKVSLLRVTLRARQHTLQRHKHYYVSGTYACSLLTIM